MLKARKNSKERVERVVARAYFDRGELREVGERVTLSKAEAALLAKKLAPVDSEAGKAALARARKRKAQAADE